MRSSGSDAVRRRRPAAHIDPMSTNTTSNNSCPMSMLRLKNDANTGSADASRPAMRTAIGNAIRTPRRTGAAELSFPRACTAGRATKPAPAASWTKAWKNRAASSAAPRSKADPREANEAARPSKMRIARRSGHSSHGLARTVNQHANNTAATTSSRDWARSSRPTRMATNPAITNVSDAPSPNVPVRRDWSATNPMSSALAVAIQVARQRTLTPAQSGRGAEPTGRQLVPSQRQRPSGDS